MFEPKSVTKLWLKQEEGIATASYPVPTLSPTAGSAEIDETLIKICAAYEDVGNDWIIVKSPIGFLNKKAKQWWDTPDDIWDTKKIATIAALEREKWESAKYKIALFTTKQTSCVGKPRSVWSSEDWHCWVAILRKMPKGKTGCELIIWDCNFDQNNILGRLPRATGVQHVFIDKLRHSTTIHTVWIGGGGNTPEGQCLQLSIEFIDCIIRGRKIGNLPPYEEMEDYGWREVDYMRSTRSVKDWTPQKWEKEQAARGMTKRQFMEFIQGDERDLAPAQEEIEFDEEYIEKGAKQARGMGKHKKKWATRAYQNRVNTRSSSSSRCSIRTAKNQTNVKKSGI